MLPSQVVDLAHPFSPDFPLFPVYNPVELAKRFVVKEDNFYCQAWSFDEHSGTHVDAPAHFAADGATVDRIPPEELVLNAAVVDIRARVEQDHDAVLVPDDILGWESRHGELPDRCAVLALTGWSERAGDPGTFMNVDAAGVLHFPGFSAEAAAFLRDERPGVRAIGLDTASLDHGPTSTFPAHVAWLPSGRYGIENLRNLDRLPPASAMIAVGVPAWERGSGGPVRVLGLIA
jgi:kynurenine formamidase